MLHAISEKTREEIGVQCEMEKRRPFTMNEHYFMQSNSGKYTQLINLRRSKNSSRHFKYNGESTLAITARSRRGQSQIPWATGIVERTCPSWFQSQII